MKTMTEIMITATCIYDNRPEYDDTPFLYDETPQERKDNRNSYYDNRNRHNDNLNPNDDYHDVNNVLESTIVLESLGIPQKP